MLTLLKSLIPAKATSVLATMPQEDLDIIQRFAAGDHDLREAAMDAHHRNIGPGKVGLNGNDHQRFMAEYDTPIRARDWGLIERYRAKLLKTQPIAA
jgi:hypothetical protein